MRLKLSIIIPCYNDETALTNLLPKLVEAGSDYDTEIIVVDGAKSDVCKRIVENIDGRYLRSETGRGKQIIKGTEVATGQLYWFLHADAIVPSLSLKIIMDACLSGASAGYFRFAFAGPSTLITRFLTYWINIRPQIGGIAYGDQGLFIKADLYNDLGGYDPLPLFEEVALIRKLKKYNQLTSLDAEIQVDPRRWQRDGFWKRTIINRVCAIAYMFGISAEKVAGWYRASMTSQNSDLRK